MINLTADRTERLDRFLARSLPEHSRTKLAKLIGGGEVLVDAKSQRASFELKPGMLITLPVPLPEAPHDLTPADIALDVRYEDDFLLVINKPRGLAVHPAASLKEPSLVNALLFRSHDLSHAAGDLRPGIVHRLDKDTTGLILIAKNDFAHVKLARQIEGKFALRRYVAVVAGNIEHERFDVAAPIARNKSNRILMAADAHGKTALTHFKRLAFIPSGTLLAAALETGRTHQIRVHLQSMGHPVLGDRLYAPRQFRDLPLQLHAAFISFEHPQSEERIEVFAAPPSDFLGGENVKQGDLERF